MSKAAEALGQGEFPPSAFHTIFHTISKREEKRGLEVEDVAQATTSFDQVGVGVDAAQLGA
jgi:hypothetical protein